MNKKPGGSFYRHVLKDAWHVAARNPVLWVFGFFVSFLGNGGIYELLIQGTGRLGLEEPFGGFSAVWSIFPNARESFAAIGELGAFNVAAAGLLMVALLGMAAIGVWVVVSSQGSLITGIRDRLRQRKTSFSSMFASGNEVAAPLFFLNAVSRIAVTLGFYLLLSLMVLLLSEASLANALLYLIAFLILIPLTVIVGFVTIYAASYMTLYRTRLVEGLEAAIALFRAYWLISLETAVILFALNVAAAIMLGAAVFVLIAFFFVVYGFFLAAGFGAWLFFFVSAVITVTLLVLTGAFLATFQYSVWTALFLRLNTRGHGGVSKLVRLFHHLLS